MKRMRLRYAGTCAACGSALAVGATAWWDPAVRRVWCVPCQAPGVPPTSGARPEVDAAVPVDRGVPGASAEREGARRSARREERIRARHPRLGGLVLALTDDPRSTKVWSTGAVGEVKVGAALEAAADRGIDVLHDRRIPGSRANIDHLVVAPSGVWAIDAKRYSGRLECRDVGGWFRTDLRLFVGGRDKTTLVAGVRRQVDHVRAALAEAQKADVPVRGALCFVDTEVGLFAKPFRLDDVVVSWPRRLIPTLAEGDAVERRERDALLRELAARFPPA
jgi:hypothetical protein